jgi:hypothetical protein
MLLIAALLVPRGALAHEMPFEETKLIAVEQGQAKTRDVALIFDDLDFTLRDRSDRGVLHKIKYETVSRFAYEFAEQPKFLEGPAPTSGKQHWLAIYYEDSGAPTTMVLILDEYEYRNVLTVCRIIAEKEVEGAPEE